MNRLLRSKIRTGFFISTLIFSFFSSAHAQHLVIGKGSVKTEIGLNFGPTFFLGDLGGHRGKGTTFVKDLNLPLTKFMKGAFIGFYPNNWLGFRIAAQYTYVEGKDNIISTKGEDELYRKQRNLDFKSNMFEAYGAVEIFPFMLRNNEEDDAPRLRPYVFIGVGMFNFNPKGSLADSSGNLTWYDLHPLHTEGQGFSEYKSRKPYSLTQINIPLGAGLKYFASERINLALELLYRKTFTDYIDDLSTDYIDPNLFDKYLSPKNAAIARQIHDKTFATMVPGSPRAAPGYQRGNPKNMDAYFSFVLKCGVRLGPVEHSSSSGSRNQMRCPSRF